MNYPTFFVQIFLLSFLLGSILYALILNSVLYAPWSLCWMGIAFYFLFSLGMFIAGKKAVNAAKAESFTNVALVSTLAKMILTAAIVFIFDRIYDPQGSGFILSFILIYVIFTAHETYFMMKLSKEKNN